MVTPEKPASDKSPSREFWIDLGSKFFQDFNTKLYSHHAFHNVFAGGLHVIEYSAYQKLEQELAEATKERDIFECNLYELQSSVSGKHLSELETLVNAQIYLNERQKEENAQLKQQNAELAARVKETIGQLTNSDKYIETIKSELTSELTQLKKENEELCEEITNSNKFAQDQENIIAKLKEQLKMISDLKSWKIT